MILEYSELYQTIFLYLSPSRSILFCLSQSQCISVYLGLSRSISGLLGKSLAIFGYLYQASGCKQKQERASYCMWKKISFPFFPGELLQRSSCSLKMNQMFRLLENQKTVFDVSIPPLTLQCVLIILIPPTLHPH